MMHVKDYYEDCVSMGVFDYFDQKYEVRNEMLSMSEQDELDDLLKLRQSIIDLSYELSNINHVFKSEKDFKNTVADIKRQQMQVVNERIIDILVKI